MVGRLLPTLTVGLPVGKVFRDSLYGEPIAEIEQVEGYCQQIEVFHLATLRSMSVDVEAHACFLGHGCREYVCSAEALDAALKRLG